MFGIFKINEYIYIHLYSFWMNNGKQKNCFEKATWASYHMFVSHCEILFSILFPISKLKMKISWNVNWIWEACLGYNQGLDIIMSLGFNGLLDDNVPKCILVINIHLSFRQVNEFESNIHPIATLETHLHKLSSSH